jgi:uncharacterized Zn finger protein (UPF0148 family)
MFACAHCGFKRAETLDEASARLRERGQRPNVALTTRVAVDQRARSLFDSGQDSLWRDDKAAAMRAFAQALDIQHDFADAHLWIAKTSDDPHVQRDHLGSILAHDPGHVEALHLLMVLDGTLTPEEAERIRSGQTPAVQQAESALKTDVATLICPVCGGGLTVDEASGRVICRFCGHTAPLAGSRQSNASSGALGAALLKRRAQKVRWVVGARILHCSRCGAERTIPAGRLSTVCPFCASTQVIQQDALNTIEQPFGLVPFTVSEESAQAAIRERLKGMGERLAGLLDDNKVARATMEGIYLPFWVFDAVAEVSRTTVDRRTPNSYPQAATFRPYENVKMSDGLVGVSVPAVKSPALLGAVDEFDTGAAVAYEPKLLAKYPAALYDIEVDEAANGARTLISEQMRRRYGKNSGDSKVEVQVYTSVLQMTFMLLLMPVWVVTLYERDGDVRPALVNGQSGAVTLGKAQKAS